MNQSHFHYIVENKNDQHKPWLVLVNGLFAPLESWDAQVESLVKDFRVLRYDGPGQGSAPHWPGDFSLETLTLYLEELLEELNIEKAYFIGLSNGGRISLRLAEKSPRKVLGLVAADTYASVSNLLKRKLASWLEANRVGGPTHRFDVATPWIWGESLLEEKEELLDFYRERAGSLENRVVEGLIIGAMENQSIDLGKIKCPSLFICGKEDLLTPSLLHKKMQEQLKGSLFYEVPGGHASLLEYPETMEKVILPWLQNLKKQNHTQVHNEI
ncbi:MAG: hypothetical protein CME63_05135 [Halobacteriovoraceae bacterium]|nr:hypothetical protein [Halobacteriovoraceae bacterium]|tara:strand:+ start:44105 stop:44917 length:813 start_codon:yes stop_codon:yes gene_type:complete